MSEYSPEDHGSGGRNRWVFWAFLAMAGFFLITERRAPSINLERKPS